LVGLYEYIAERAGYKIAGGYIDRIEAACMALATFPNRGIRRDDILPGLRTIGFERRITIVFRVLKTQVEIITIAYAGEILKTTCGGNRSEIRNTTLVVQIRSAAVLSRSPLLVRMHP